MARPAAALIAGLFALLWGGPASAYIWTNSSGQMLLRDANGVPTGIDYSTWAAASKVETQGSYTFNKAGSWTINDPRVPRTFSVPVTNSVTLPRALLTGATVGAAFISKLSLPLAIASALGSIYSYFKSDGNAYSTNASGLAMCAPGGYSGPGTACDCAAGVGAGGSAQVLNAAGTAYVAGTWTIHYLPGLTGERFVNNCSSLPYQNGMAPVLWTQVSSTGEVPITASQMQSMLDGYYKTHAWPSGLMGDIQSWLQANAQPGTVNAPTESSSGQTQVQETTTKTQQETGGQNTYTTVTTYNVTVAGDSYSIDKSANTTSSLLGQWNSEHYTYAGADAASATSANGGSPASSTAGQQQQPPSDLCKDHPDVLACQTLGTAEPDQVPTKTIPVTFSPDSGYGEGAGSCPADKQLSFMGKALVFKYQPICDFALGIRPIVIAAGYLIAAYIFLGVARRESSA